MGNKLVAAVLITAMLISTVPGTAAWGEEDILEQDIIIESTSPTEVDGQVSGVTAAPEEDKFESDSDIIEEGSAGAEETQFDAPETEDVTEDDPASTEGNSGNNNPDAQSAENQSSASSQSGNTDQEQAESEEIPDSEIQNGENPTEESSAKEYYYVEYVTDPDSKYGKPSDEVLPDIEAYEIKPDELIIIELKPDLSSAQTDIIIVNEAGEDETFTGTWTFSGWMCDTQDIDLEFRTLPVTEDTIIYGNWTFTPDEVPVEQPAVITVPDELPSYEWATGVVDLSVLYYTGYLDQPTVEAALWNMENVPVQQRRFKSIEIKREERESLVDAVESVISDIRNGDNDLVDAEEPDTMLLISAAERAGLLSGSTKFFIDANREDLYAWMTGTAFCETGSLNKAGVNLRFARPGNLFFWKDDDNSITKVGIVTEVSGKYLTIMTAGDQGEIQSCVTFAEDGENCGELVIPRCSDTGRIIFDYLMNVMGYNKAISTGILANMYSESALNTRNLGDGNTSLGLCQWHNGRCARLIEFCLSNGYNICSLEGQLEYFNYELNNNYSSLVSWFEQLQDCKVAAETAGMGMCRWFEMPAEVDAKCAERSAMAGYMYGIYGNICCEDELPSVADTGIPVASAEQEVIPEQAEEAETEPVPELERSLAKPVPAQEITEQEQPTEELIVSGQEPAVPEPEKVENLGDAPEAGETPSFLQFLNKALQIISIIGKHASELKAEA